MPLRAVADDRRPARTTEPAMSIRLPRPTAPRPIRAAATLAAAGLAGLAACSDSTGSEGAAALNLTAAFNSIPAGYSEAANSYAGGAPTAGLWLADGRGDRLPPGSMMGGGMRDDFVGGMTFGRGRGGEGPFGGGLLCFPGGVAGTFDPATGRVSCSAETRGGLTIARSAAYATAAGAVQPGFDSLTTDRVNLRTSVTGTVAFPDSGRGRREGAFGFGFDDRGRGPGRGRGRGRGGDVRALLGDTATITSATTQITAARDRTTSGLAQGSPQRTVNGTSSSVETTTGVSSIGNFTATRLVADTTVGLVIPVRTASGAPTYPTAGTVTRVIAAGVTLGNGAPVTTSRREVVTYDGSATARVTLTVDGTTRNCTRPLPRGPLTCS